MKSILSIVSIFFFAGTFALQSQTSSSCVTDVILSGYTARKFTTEPVSENDIELILKCGIKAPSARNTQLWKFTVIRDQQLMSKAIQNVSPGNVLIFISGKEDEQRIDVEFDCALATENMFIAAQGLGLGGHIYTGPVRQVNENLKAELAIPEGYRVVSILEIGHIDKVDAVSSATKRKSFDEVVNYK